MASLAPIINFLRTQWPKIIFSLFSAVFFFFIFFPYDDLSDFVTGQVAKLSQNQVFIQFDGMGLSFIPSPAIKLSDVELDMANLPTLKAGSIDLAPSIASFLSFRTGMDARAENFLNGNVDLSFREGDKLDDGERIKNISIQAEQIEMSKVMSLISAPINLKGSANTVLEVSIDPSFRQQPDGELELSVSKMRLPPSTIPTQLGPISLPQIEFSKFEIKGRLVGSELIINDTFFGSTQDDIHGKLRGKMGVTINKRGLSIQPRFSSYDLKVEFFVKDSMERQLSAFLGLIDSKYKNRTNVGTRYAFRAAGSGFGSTPRFSTISSF